MALPARVGRYEIEIVIGHGAVGRVLLARDPRLGRQVAVKVLRDDLGVAEEVRTDLAAQFRRGASAAAALTHPALVAIHDLGEDDSVGVYVVSELVSGLTLHERMARGRLMRNEVASLARALGSALASAHAAGVVHGDVKPENIFLSAHGPKLGDFGFPGALPQASDSGALPEGLPSSLRAYHAPEVLAGGPASARADQYALAVSLHEALTGRPPLGPSGSATATSSSALKARGTSSLLPELRGASHLDAIFDCALAADPRRRFPSCEAFGSTLAEVLEATQSTLPTPPTSQSSIVPRSTRRWQNAVAGIAVMVIFALVALGGQRGQRRAASDGVSLKSVSGAFSDAIAAPHPRPTPVPPMARSDVHPVSTALRAGADAAFTSGDAASPATPAKELDRRE